MEDLIKLFKNVDPSQISRNKASETLMYVRYLLTREHDAGKLTLLESYKSILETRLAEISSLDDLSIDSTIESPHKSLSNDLTLENSDSEIG